MGVAEIWIAWAFMRPTAGKEGVAAKRHREAVTPNNASD